MRTCVSRCKRDIVPIGCLPAIIFTGQASPASSQEVHGPKQYYLALGDSITYGYQAYKHAAGLPPSAFNTASKMARSSSSTT